MQNYAVFLQNCRTSIKELLFSSANSKKNSSLKQVVCSRCMNPKQIFENPQKKLFSAKKGGRYTKKEQEERKIQVYHLHFEENKSAIKIAELLNVNRNTINEDIRYWHLQLANEMKAQDLTAKMTKQIQRMEIQRDRLLEDLDESESLDEKIKLEKFISDIDNRLAQLFSKMISSGIKSLEPTVNLEEINEDEIKEFVRDLILGDEDPNSEDIYSEDNLKFDFIRKTKCDVKHANNVIEKMNRDGLALCAQSEGFKKDHSSLFSDDFSTTYNLGKFGNLRGYLTIDELGTVLEKRAKTRQEMKKEREEKFIAKYGPDKSKWSEDVKEMYDNFEDLD